MAPESTKQHHKHLNIVKLYNKQGKVSLATTSGHKVNQVWTKVDGANPLLHFVLI